MKALHIGLSTTPKSPISRHSFPSYFTTKPNFYLPKKHTFIHQDSYYKTQKNNIIKPIIISSSMAATPSETKDKKPFSVLFVCLGNICRSPAAEGVFTHLVKQKGLDSSFVIDSAGTINYHEGNDADPRMKAASKRRGIQITSLSRPIRPSDFKDFDLILAMDKQNKDDILAAFERWSFRETLPADSYKKVKLMCSYCKKHTETQVPDPYYGGPQGFEKVLDLLEDACESLLESILAENTSS